MAIQTNGPARRVTVKRGKKINLRLLRLQPLARLPRPVKGRRPMWGGNHG
jgi:hypothetical protein